MKTCPEVLLDLTDNSITIENSDKSKYLYIVVTDGVGNKTVFKSNLFTADITAPSGDLSKATNIYFTNKNEVAVKISATDNYSSNIYMQMKIDEG